MRPVNLMPPEDRGGARAPLRTGVVPYVLLGALALGLLGIVALTLTSKQISDSEAEKQSLTQELEVATARAQSLRAFSDFRAVQEQRTATVSSLAQSRFDWERVMNELALVIPTDVWLIQLTGTVTPAVELDGGADISIRDTVAGPALEIVGCAPSQDAVAGFVAAVEDIDGVTRVGIASSGLSEDDNASQAPPTGVGTATSTGTEDTIDDCRTREFISQFEIVVAFDEVPVPAAATAAPGVPAAPAPATDSSQVSDGQQQVEDSKQSASQQTSEAKQAANIIPGG